MNRIKTLVYFDIEATGLKSSGRPRITELSLVAVNLQDVLELHGRIMVMSRVSRGKSQGERQSLVEQLQPRVINKLTLCFNPMTTIPLNVTDITGLDNYNLENQARFDSGTVELVQSFLSRLLAPVCLVAHNGEKYDFPLLLAEVAKCQGSLTEEILCVDSYLGCRLILQQRKQIQIEAEELDSLSELLNAGAFDEGFEENTDSVTDSDCSRKRKTEDSGPELDSFKKSRIPATENETTPARKKTEQSSRRSQPLITSSFKAKKRLTLPESSRAPSLTLSSLHSRLLGSAPAQSHGAEADCLALVRLTSALGQDWLDYVHNNNKPLTACKPMWTW